MIVIHPHYRPGAEIAVDGRLDPRGNGDASDAGHHDEQTLKRVWHCLTRSGAPAAAR